MELYLTAVAYAVVFVLTVMVMRTLGRRIARRSRVLAVLVSALVLPMLMVALSIAWFLGHSDVPQGDAAFALVATIFYALLALPFTVSAAVIALRGLEEDRR